MSEEEFERFLDGVTSQLTEEAQQGPFPNSKVFENRVRDHLKPLADRIGALLSYDPHPYVFPDIAIGEFGVEVKFTKDDSWRSVANSVFETFRNQEVAHVYVVYGKMGGDPKVRWDRYADCVRHVRTSHVPRFEIEIGTEEKLFPKMGVKYQDFCLLPMEEKMRHIRKYATGRLKKGERLWWLDDKPEPERSIPIELRLYMHLSAEDKRNLRTEVTLLCPQVVSGPRARNKYNDATIYLLTYRGIVCPQMRDLFTAGSVVGKERGGNYLLRATRDIEPEMRAAAEQLDDALFVEYWKEFVSPENRISRWLELADTFAVGWVPSKELFQSK